MSSAHKICALIKNVSEIMQHQGMQHFEISGSNKYFRTIELCGLCLTINADKVIRVTARDLDIVLRVTIEEPSNDNKSLGPQQYGHYEFIKGTIKELEHWYNRLSSFQAAPVKCQGSLIANDTIRKP